MSSSLAPAQQLNRARAVGAAVQWQTDRLVTWLQEQKAVVRGPRRLAVCRILQTWVRLDSPG